MSNIPFFPYKLFFLYIEPISAFAGAYYAALKPAEYLQDLTMTPLITNNVATLTNPMVMSLAQLANLYLLFGLNEHLVLSSTSSMGVWRRLLFCLLWTPCDDDAFGFRGFLEGVGVERDGMGQRWICLLRSKPAD